MKRFFGAKFTSTLSITLVLFVLGLMTMGGLVSAHLAEELREQFTVTITVSDIASANYGQRLVERLVRAPYTASAVYVSSDSALSVLQSELGESPEEFLGYNPLPRTVELNLKAEYVNSDSIRAIIAELQTSQKSYIEEIDYNDGLLDMVNRQLRRVYIGLCILALVLLVICVSLIGNTVRLMLYADRFQINTMRLVGATKWFVRRPFIRTHVCCGLLATLFSLLALAGLIYSSLSEGFTRVIADSILEPVPLGILISVEVALGILIPALAAWFAADRYMGRKVDDLYLM